MQGRERTSLRGGALAAVFGMVLAGCATAPPKAPEQAATDEALAQRVYSTLDADPTYYFRHVNVQVSDGVALLSGYVWSPQAIFRARALAGTVPGVARVVNQMELERNGANGGHSASR